MQIVKAIGITYPVCIILWELGFKELIELCYTPPNASSVSSVPLCPYLDISCLLSASMKLCHAYLLACK